MTDGMTKTTPTEAEATNSAVEPELTDHPGADTLNVPSWDDAGFLRWGHAESDVAAPRRVGGDLQPSRS
jgi:hypothetical protein